MPWCCDSKGLRFHPDAHLRKQTGLLSAPFPVVALSEADPTKAPGPHRGHTRRGEERPRQVRPPCLSTPPSALVVNGRASRSNSPAQACDQAPCSAVVARCPPLGCESLRVHVSPQRSLAGLSHLQGAFCLGSAGTPAAYSRTPTSPSLLRMAKAATMHRYAGAPCTASPPNACGKAHPLPRHNPAEAGGRYGGFRSGSG